MTFWEKWLTRSWRDVTFIGFDTETSGKFPLSADVCEMAAVKWRGGRVVDTYQTLLKPREPMSAEVIAIHGITNDMVTDAPRMPEKIAEFHAFIQDGVPVAHHAPFDLGFMSIEMERAGLALPAAPVICTSLLSIKVLPESSDHRLQTLIPFLKIEKGAAHRAQDDARACLEVALFCMQRLGDVTLEQVLAAQGGPLFWSRFSLTEIKRAEIGRALLAAIESHAVVELTYGGGSSPGESRRVHPRGFVRSLDGDYLVAYCEAAQRDKRYVLDRIKSVQLI